MAYLGGDSHFNKWMVPLIPINSLHRVDAATHHAISEEQADAEMMDTEGGGRC